MKLNVTSLKGRYFKSTAKTKQTQDQYEYAKRHLQLLITIYLFI